MAGAVLVDSSLFDSALVAPSFRLAADMARPISRRSGEGPSSSECALLGDVYVCVIHSGRECRWVGAYAVLLAPRSRGIFCLGSSEMSLRVMQGVALVMVVFKMMGVIPAWCELIVLHPTPIGLHVRSGAGPLVLQVGGLGPGAIPHPATTWGG